MAWCLIKDGVKFFFNLHENPTPSKSNKIKKQDKTVMTVKKKIPTMHKARSILCYLPITMELNVIKALLILRNF